MVPDSQFGIVNHQGANSRKQGVKEDCDSRGELFLIQGVQGLPYVENQLSLGLEDPCQKSEKIPMIHPAVNLSGVKFIDLGKKTGKRKQKGALA